MTGRFWLVCLAILAVFFLALFTLRGDLIALIMPLVVYLAAAVFQAPEKVSLSAERTLSSTEVPEKKAVLVRVRVRNEGIELQELLLEDILPHQAGGVDGETRHFTILPPGETFEFDYFLTSPRGKYEYYSLHALATDPFGFFQNEQLVSATASLLVLPVFYSIRSPLIRPRQTRGFAGAIPARIPGSGTDFFGVRQYQPGDPLRRINWHVAAHSGEELFSNEYEQERIADVGIILDARKQTDVRAPRTALFEYGVRAAGSLAEAYLKEGHRVGLLIYGNGIERVFPGYGKVQRERITRVLAEARTGENFALETFNFLPVRFFPPKSQIVLVSPLMTEDIRVLGRIRSHGYEVLVVSPDPVHFEADFYHKDDLSRLAVRLAVIERQLMLRRLRRVGIRVINWPVERDLAEVIRTAPDRRPAGRLMWEALP
jgi:uncharacterized protein (DUF58 family)